MRVSSEPLAFFLTWSTYGTWLPGDGRGWVEYRKGWKLPDPILELESKARMTEDSCWLGKTQRGIVESTIAEHCVLRNWELLAVNCRSNHIHVVVAALRDPKEIQRQFKAWCTRRLKEAEVSLFGEDKEIRENWWAERGSRRWINDEISLEAAILYVKEAQDRHLSATAIRPSI